MADMTLEDLGKIYPQPNARVIAKVLPLIDDHAKNFIEMSPFCVLASAAADGSVDASPRGGTPGFVHVENAKTLLMPDRPGNNRLDNFKNIIEGSGLVHLLFFVPGIDETLRINGKASVVTDGELLERMVEFNKLPRAVVRIDVIETYFHCGKAIMRSKLWTDQARVKRSSFPSLGQINLDRTSMGGETQEEIEAIYKEQL